LDKYAKDKPYVIVTGASEGIGRQLALDLADTKLFNLCLVSRSKDKLQEVKKTIGKECRVKLAPVDLAYCPVERYS